MADSFIKLPPDGAGKALHTVEHQNGSHNQVMTLGDPDILENQQRVDEYGAAYVRGSEGSTLFDSFGKTKVSEETVLANYMPVHDTMPDRFSTQITGTASEIYVSAERSIRLQVDISSGDRIVRTSHKYHKYSPGTSQLIMMTVASGDSGKVGVTRRWGYFDDDNGVFFEQDGLDNYVVIRSNIGGTPVDRRIAQADFNLDKADGTGISGLNIDPSKANIYFIDLQWLGVGRVRFGVFGPQGNRIVLHSEENANRFNSVYMGTASLPVRHEAFNTAATGGASELKILNTVVFTEAVQPTFTGDCHSTMNGATTPIAITDSATHLMTFKPSEIYKSKTNRNAHIPLNMSIICSETTQVTILKNANLSGTETYALADTESGMEVSKDGVYVDGGIKKYCTVMPAGVNRFDLKDDFSYIGENLTIHADGNANDTYTIVAKTIGGAVTGTAICGLRWQEIIL